MINAKNKILSTLLLTLSLSVIPYTNNIAFMAPTTSDVSNELSNKHKKNNIAITNKDDSEKQRDKSIQLNDNNNNNKEQNNIFIKKINIITDLKTDKLYKNIINKYTNRTLTKSELTTNLLQDINIFYKNEGYLAAKSKLKVETTTDNSVSVIISKGYLGKIEFKNHSKYLKDEIIENALSVLKFGDVVYQKNIESALYTIDDIDGITVSGVLYPTDNKDVSNLMVNVYDKYSNKKNNDSILTYIENYGNKYSGRYRLGTIYNKYDLTGNGDNLSIGMVSSDKNLYNYSISYDIFTGKKRYNKSGINLSRTDYKLADDMSALDATGTSNEISIYNSNRIFKSVRTGIDINYGYKYKNIKDDIHLFNISSQKHSNQIYAELVGFNLPSNNSYISGSATFSVGHLINDSNYANNNNYYSNIEGIYYKMLFNSSYIMKLMDRLTFRFNTAVQFASKNLDGSEKMYLGGINNIRAYPDSEASGDSGYFSQFELIYKTKIDNLISSIFYDTGEVRITKSNPYEHRILHGYGINFTYFKDNDYVIKLTYAKRIGDIDIDDSNEAKKNGRFWLFIGKYF